MVPNLAGMDYLSLQLSKMKLKKHAGKSANASGIVDTISPYIMDVG